MSRWERFLEFFGCKPDHTRVFIGIGYESVCVRCKSRILQDSQGNWFPAAPQEEEK